MLCCGNHPVTDSTEQESLWPPTLPPCPLPLYWCWSSIPCIKPACPVTLPAIPSSAAVPSGGVADPAGPVWTLGPQARPCPPVWLSEAHQALVTCSQQTRDKTCCWLSCMPRNPPRCISCSGQNFRDHWLLLWRQMLSLAKDSWNMQVESLFK